MDNVNRTLYIPLYGKSLVSSMGILLHDPKAEALWASQGFPLKGKSASKWLAYYMGMRSAVFDRWLTGRLAENPGAAVLHLGCGLDSRVLRVKHDGHLWFDVDFPAVMETRSRHYEETEENQMLWSDLREEKWLLEIPDGPVIVLMEGVSMYLRREELELLLSRLTGRFPKVELLMDCYTEFAAKASRYKNPIDDVGVTQVYGYDDPRILTDNNHLEYAGERDMTPEDLIRQLPQNEQWIFRKLYAGGIARKMYRLYEYRK